MGETYLDPAREIPMHGRYDVVVCGGGPAGCAAATAAGRHGARVLLVEREGYLGGAPCTQNVVPILSTNAVDFQGLWHEWARALQACNGITAIHREPRCGTKWYAGSVDPEAVKLVWDDLLTAADVDILHFAQAAGAILEDGLVKGVIIQTKPGRRAVFADRVIDCTGDADVCDYAGCGFDQGVAGAPWAMGASFVGLLGNVPTAADYVSGWSNPVGKTGRSVGNLPLFPTGLPRLLEVDPLDPEHLTRVVRDGRRECRRGLEQRRALPGFEDVFLAGTPNLPGIRSSRRVHGIRTSSAADATELRKYVDGVVRSSWEIDIHSATDPVSKGVMSDDPEYRKRQERTEQGDYYDIPYGCLVAADADNLLVAGRCISAAHESQASLRIQQTCMSLGQAAGVAAALSLQQGVTPRDLEAAAVVDQLAIDRDVEPAFSFKP